MTDSRLAFYGALVARLKASARSSPPKAAAPRRAKVQKAENDRPYAHLSGSSLPYREVSEPAAKRPPTKAEEAINFAERMEQVAARVAGREPRRLVAAPEQGVTRVSGSDLIAAQRRREAERASRGQG